MILRETLPAFRPREKLLSFGPESLTREELWMCILGAGRRGLPVEALARQVVKKLDEPKATRQVASWGTAQLARILAVEELCQRWEKKTALPMASLETVLLLCQDLRVSRMERIRVFYCSTTGQVLHQQTVAVGGLNMAVVQPRDIFYPIRFQPVDSLVICHNHPGGTPNPSQEDTVFTQKMEQACQLLGLWLRDHVIITKEKHFSFRQKGMLSAH